MNISIQISDQDVEMLIRALVCFQSTIPFTRDEEFKQSQMLQDKLTETLDYL